MGPNFSQIAQTQAKAIRSGQSQAAQAAGPATGGSTSMLDRIRASVNQAKANIAAKPALPTPPALQAPAPAPVAPAPTPAASFQYPEGYDPSGLEAVKKIALAEPGTSAWAQMAKQKQLADEAAQLDKTALQSAGSLAEARDAVAMRGGLSSGASENLARSAMESQLLGQQGVRQAGDIARANIGLQDWQQQMDLLKGLPAAQTGVYAEMMKAKGAEALAKAIENQKGNTFNIGNKDPVNAPKDTVAGGIDAIVPGGGAVYDKLQTVNPALNPLGYIGTAYDISKKYGSNLSVPSVYKGGIFS